MLLITYLYRVNISVLIADNRFLKDLGIAGERKAWGKR